MGITRRRESISAKTEPHEKISCKRFHGRMQATHSREWSWAIARRGPPALAPAADRPRSNQIGGWVPGDVVGQTHRSELPFPLSALQLLVYARRVYLAIRSSPPPARGGFFLIYLFVNRVRHVQVMATTNCLVPDHRPTPTSISLRAARCCSSLSSAQACPKL